jgi:hypothetical protein
VESSTYTSGAPSGGSGAPLKDQVKQTAQQAKEQTQQMAGQAIDKARTQVKSGLTEQKDRLADTVGSVAEALRGTGRQLQDQQHEGVGQYAFQAADMVESIGGYFREHSVDDVVHEVEDFARRQPALFLGTAFALGFLAARFIKSSSQQAGGWSGNGGMRRQEFGGGYAGAQGGEFLSGGVYGGERLSGPYGSEAAGGGAFTGPAATTPAAVSVTEVTEVYGTDTLDDSMEGDDLTYSPGTRSEDRT